MLKIAISPKIPPLRKKKQFLPDKSTENHPKKVSQACATKAVSGQVDKPASNALSASRKCQLSSLCTKDY